MASPDSYGFFLKRLQELKSDASESASSARSFEPPPESLEARHLVAVLKPLSQDDATGMADVFKQSGIGDIRTFSKAVQQAVEYSFVEVEGTKREGEAFYLTEMGRLFLEEQT
jgi:hypothetical protein